MKCVMLCHACCHIQSGTKTDLPLMQTSVPDFAQNYLKSQGS
jgi:hypothetical protein